MLRREETVFQGTVYVLDHESALLLFKDDMSSGVHSQNPSTVVYQNHAL